MARILIADDVSDACARLADALRTDGHDTVELSSGWELLEALADESEPADMVLTDSRMAFPDGLSVATLARAAGVHCPILVLTGIANERARKVARGLGDVILLEPPAELDRIIEAVDRSLLRATDTVDSRWVGAVDLFSTSDPDDD